MEPTLVIAIFIAVAGIAAGLFLSSEARRIKKAYLLEKDALDKERARLESKPRAKKSPVGNKNDKAASNAEMDQLVQEKNKALQEAQSELKDFKKQVYDLKQELKEARIQSENNENSSSAGIDQETLISAREELSSLKVELLDWKKKAQELQDQLKTAQSSQPKQEKAIPTSSPGTEMEDQLERVKAELSRVKAELKSSLDSARQAENELKNKLKKSARQVDRQRRRAENNDKAYKITQRQLDILREREQFLEEQLRKANFVSASEAGIPSNASNQKEQSPAISVPEKDSATQNNNTSTASASVDEAWADIEVEK